MADLEEALIKTVAVLNDLSIPYVVVGGMAAIHRGSPRTTSDIDVIMSIGPGDGDRLIDAFTNAGYIVLEEQLRLVFLEGHNASIYLPSSVIRVDIKVARKPDEAEVIAQAEDATYKGLSFKIATVEQVLYGKVMYLGDVSDLDDDELLDFNDARDFVSVFQSASRVDIDWVRCKTRAIGLEQTLDRLLARIHNS